MILKCTNCGGALQYDAVTNNMLCPLCFSTYEVDWDNMDGNDTADGGTYGSKFGNTYDAEGQDEADDCMDSNIYTCTSCGAELIINGVESATFCAYCGQPTIVFSRVSKMKKPKYILPFAVTKEQAHSIIRTRFDAGKFVPQSVKDFKPEVLRGIYVPFMLYDVAYRDRQLIKSVQKSGRSSHTYYYFREAQNSFSRITVDASASFNDESSQRLEPYDLRNIQPFHVGYLSGFYADCIDDDTQKMESTAKDRSKELFDAAVLRTVPGSSKEIIVNKPFVNITKADYVMLPVWFLIFNEQGRRYTIMVNGQTGKMVGAVPCDKDMVKANLIFYCSVCSVIAASLLGIILRNATFEEGAFKLITLLCFAIGGLALFANHLYASYKKSLELTTANQIRHLVSDRQEEQ